MSMSFPVALLIAIGALLQLHCVRLREAVGLPCAAYDFALPPGAPQPSHPPGVCLTPERVELGRLLFYDKRLSKNETQSCATCHVQSLGFADGRARAIGSTGQVHPRNAQGLANVGSFGVLTWNNPALHRLDNQTLIPFFSQNTESTIEELAISGAEHTVAARLLSDARYSRLFGEAFAGHTVNITTVALALAAFQSTLVSFRSPYDRNDLSESARRGKGLFFSARTRCSECHAGPLFNLDSRTEKLEYFNIGLYNINARGDYPDFAIHGPAALRRTQGLFVATGKPADRGRFRTPSLRNVAFTAPYMHDGSVSTLEEVVEVFNAGGRNVRHGPFTGDGRQNPNKDPRLTALSLSPQERADLVSFLEALSDDCFVRDARFSSPFDVATAGHPAGAARAIPPHCR